MQLFGFNTPQKWFFLNMGDYKTPTPPPPAATRITDEDDVRVTDADDTRITD